MSSDRLRAPAIAAVVAGAIGSLGLMFYVGRRQQSLMLIVMFTVWVAAPFVGAFLAARMSSRWSSAARVTLYVSMIVVALGSVGVYARVAFGMSMAKPAAPFLIVPVVSVLLMVAAVAIAAAVSGREDDRQRP